MDHGRKACTAVACHRPLHQGPSHPPTGISNAAYTDQDWDRARPGPGTAQGQPWALPRARPGKNENETLVLDMPIVQASFL